MAIMGMCDKAICSFSELSSYVIAYSRAYVLLFCKANLYHGIHRLPILANVDSPLKKLS